MCEWCFGPLEVVYDYDAIRATVSRESIAAGPLSIWRYADLLPAAAEGAVSLGAGFTPLVRADRLAAELGLGELWIKNDTLNPTGSFKDRVVSVALTKAQELGFKVAACASTGNLANSVAAHAAQAGMESVVFIPADLEPGKVVTTAVFGGRLIAVDGTYDDVNRLCAELAGEYPSWAFVNVNVRTYYAEGSRTLAFEVAEQLGLAGPGPRRGAGGVRQPAHQGGQGLQGAFHGRAARRGAARAHLGCAGGRLLARRRGVRRRARRGAAGEAGHHRQVAGDREPGRRSSTPWTRCGTSGGSFGSVTDDEIIAGIRLLARTEGIFAETAGGVTIATLAQLAASGVVRPDERVVAYVTGNGLKTARSGRPRLPADRHHRPHPGCVRRGRRHPRGALTMAVTVRIPTQLRPLAGGSQRGQRRRRRTVGEVLKALDAAHPGFADRLFDDSGRLRRFVNVFLAEEDIRFLDGLRHAGAGRGHPVDRAGRRRRLTGAGPGWPSPRPGISRVSVALTLRRRLTVSTRDVRVLTVVGPMEGTNNRCPS